MSTSNRAGLTDLGLQRHADAFEENEVTIDDLPVLSRDDLRDTLNVTRIVDR